jgi:hypothetical protein
MRDANAHLLSWRQSAENGANERGKQGDWQTILRLWTDANFYRTCDSSVEFAH